MSINASESCDLGFCIITQQHCFVNTPPPLKKLAQGDNYKTV